MGYLIVNLVLFIIILPSPLFAAPNMHEGLWEISSTMEMEGMPFQMPETSYRQCITPDDLVPLGQEAQQDCTIIENDITGDTVTWKVTCRTEAGQTTSEGSITYHGDSFEGHTITSGANMPSKMTQTMTGKRLGPCR